MRYLHLPLSQSLHSSLLQNSDFFKSIDKSDRKNWNNQNVGKGSGLVVAGVVGAVGAVVGKKGGKGIVVLTVVV